MASKIFKFGVNVAALAVFSAIATGRFAGLLGGVALAGYVSFPSLSESVPSMVNVPEPSSFAIMIAGIAFLSFIVARSRRRR